MALYKGCFWEARVSIHRILKGGFKGCIKSERFEDLNYPEFKNTFICIRIFEMY